MMALPQIPLPPGLNGFRPQIGNLLSDIGYGISQGGFKKGFGIAGQRMAEMAPYRQQMAEEEQSRNQTLEWLKSQGDTDPRFAQLAQAVEAGGLDVGSAWQAGIGYLNETPEAAGDLADTAVGRQQLAQQYGLEGNDLATYVLTGNMPAGMDFPSGYQADPSNPAAMMPIPGSAEDYQRQQDAAAAAAEQQAAAQAQQAADQNTQFAFQSANDAIDRAIPMVGPMTAGNIMGSQAAQSIPFLGQGSADLAAEIDTIESFLGLDKLMQLKAASPNGASGLGSVTEKEMQLLVATVASLRQTQDPVILAQKLGYIKDRLAEWAAGPGQQGQGGQPQQITSDADYDALPSGTTFIAPDGTMRRKP